MQPRVVGEKLAEGVHFLSLPDNRFKTSHLTVALFLPLSEQTASEYAILPLLLRRSSAAYPDFTALNKRLNQLYGAQVFGEVTRIGECQVLILQAVGVDDRFALNGEPVAAMCADLLRGMLFEPAFENGVFRAEDLEQERRCLIEQIAAEINEKRMYARLKCEQLLCKGEAYAVNRYGTIEQVSQLTAQGVTEAWRRALETAQVQVIYQGSQGSQQVAEAFKAGFTSIPRRPVDCVTVPAQPGDGEVEEQREQMAVNQCKLVLGFKAGVGQGVESMAYRLMNAVFGATPHSMLFRNVREKLSLCYYCTSSYDRHKGVMLVDSGVDKDKVEEAKAEILRQLQLLKNGIFTDQDLESAKRSLINQFGTVDDLQSTRSIWYLGQTLDKQMMTTRQAQEMVQEITREQVIAAAKKVKLHCVYLLEPDGQPAEQSE